MVFDEDNNLKKLKVNDEDELNELFQAHKSEGSRAEAVKNMETDNADRDSSEKIEENDKYEEGPGPMQNTNKVETHSQENYDSEDKEYHTDQLQPLVSKPAWKHSSSHPLDNFISPLNYGMHTRSKTRNLVAFLALISTIKP